MQVHWVSGKLQLPIELVIITTIDIIYLNFNGRNSKSCTKQKYWLGYCLYQSRSATNQFSFKKVKLFSFYGVGL